MPVDFSYSDWWPSPFVCVKCVLLWLFSGHSPALVPALIPWIVHISQFVVVHVCIYITFPLAMLSNYCVSCCGGARFLHILPLMWSFIRIVYKFPPLLLSFSPCLSRSLCIYLALAWAANKSADAREWEKKCGMVAVRRIMARATIICDILSINKHV